MIFDQEEEISDEPPPTNPTKKSNKPNLRLVK